MWAKILISISVLVVLKGCATAQDPYAFSKISTSLDQYKIDSTDCVDLVKGTKGPNQNYASGGVGGLVLGSIAAGAQRAQIRSINYDNCMASKGYHKSQVSKEELRSFKKMNQSEKDAVRIEWLKRKQ